MTTSTGFTAMSEAFECDGLSVASSEAGVESPASPHETLAKERQLVEKLAQDETRSVRLWRRNVLIVMILTGSFVTAMAYIFLKQVDTQDYQSSVRTSTVQYSTIRI
jgi:hypothetical protein